MEHFSGFFEVLFIVLQDDQVSLVISVAEKNITIDLSYAAKCEDSDRPAPLEANVVFGVGILSNLCTIYATKILEDIYIFYFLFFPFSIFNGCSRELYS